MSGGGRDGKEERKTGRRGGGDGGEANETQRYDTTVCLGV